MKIYSRLLLISLIILVASCKKKNTDPAIKKSIKMVRIGSETPLQKIGEEYFIVVQYFKDYEGRDDVQLTVNGRKAVLAKEFEEELTGRMILFKLPPNNQIGDASVKLSIDNGQQIVSEERTLRFIEENTLPYFWQNLDKDYLSISWEGRRFKDGSLTISQIGASPSYTTNIPLGMYYLTQKTYDDRVHVPFIEGLSGKYHVSFENSLLKELKVTHGDQLTDVSYKPQQTYDEISEGLGADLISTEQDHNGHTVTTFKKEEFTLRTYATERLVYTIITKE